MSNAEESKEFVTLLILSDTHGNLEAARRAFREYGPWDHIIHLGDSLQDVVDLSAELNFNITALLGNNEYGDQESEKELVLEVEGIRFFAIHGHELDLNPYAGDEAFTAGINQLVQRAKNAGAGVALFGHTHQAMIMKKDEVLLVNPGGLSLGDQIKTFAKITISNGTITAKIITLPNPR